MPAIFVSLATIALSSPLLAWAGPPEGSDAPPPGDEPVTIEAPAEPPAADPPAVESAPVESALVEPPPPSVEAAPVEPKAEDEVTPTLANLDSEAKAPMTKVQYGIGKGLTVSSEDGRYSLQVRARLQLRYDLEHPNVEGESLEHVFQIRRARVVLAGNMFSKHVRYQFQFGFSPNDMSSGIPSDAEPLRRNPLRDARVEFDRLRDFNVWIGQFKVPFNRQRMISSSNLAVLDRSNNNAEFTLDRDLGIEAFSKDVGGLGGRLAYYVGVFMGEGRNAYEPRDPGLLYAARIEVNPFGKFEDYVEGDLARSNTPGLSIGAAYAFQDRAHAARGVLGDLPADRGTTDFHHATADVMFKWQGFSLFAATHLRRGFNRVNGGALDDQGMPIATVPARSGMGWLAQLGYLVPKIPLEIVGRYGMIRKFEFGGDETSLRNSDEVGGGLNWYFVGHDLKLQLDYFRLWDESMGTSPADAARHGTDRIRLQVQLYF